MTKWFALGALWALFVASCDGASTPSVFGTAGWNGLDCYGCRANPFNEGGAPAVDAAADAARLAAGTGVFGGRANDAGNTDATDSGPTATTGGAGGTSGDGGSGGSSGGAGENDHGKDAYDGGCIPPSAAQPWLSAFQKDVVSRLSGASEIESGVTLDNRQSNRNRETVRQYLRSIFASVGLVAQQLTYSNSGANVLAELVASAYDGVDVVVGAHFDSVDGPGADDNATGVAVVLAAMRYLKDVPCRKHNVIFVLFDQEEVGFLGSKALVQYLGENTRKVHSVHTFDMVGWDSDHDRSITLQLPGKGLVDRYQAAVDELGVDIALGEGTVDDSDHVSFMTDYPTVLVAEEFGSDTSPYWHTKDDAYATIDFDYLELTTMVAFTVLRTIVVE